MVLIELKTFCLENSAEVSFLLVALNNSHTSVSSFLSFMHVHIKTVDRSSCDFFKDVNFAFEHHKGKSREKICFLVIVLN